MEFKKLKPSALAVYLVLFHIMVEQIEDVFPHQELRYQSGSISFGRYETEPLCWERRSSFLHNKYLEEAEQCSSHGSVNQRKAFFEVFFRKKALLKHLASEHMDMIESSTSERDPPDHLNRIEISETVGNIYPISNHANNVVISVGAQVDSNITNTKSTPSYDIKHEKTGDAVQSQSIEGAPDQKHYNRSESSGSLQRNKSFKKFPPESQNSRGKVFKEPTKAGVNKVAKSVKLVPTLLKEKLNKRCAGTESQKTLLQGSGAIKAKTERMVSITQQQKPKALSQTTRRTSSEPRGSIVKSSGTLQKKSLPNEKQPVLKNSTSSSPQLKSLKAKVQGNIEAKPGRQATSKNAEVDRKPNTSVQASVSQKTNSKARQPLTRPSVTSSSKEKSFPPSAATTEQKSESSVGKTRKDVTKAVAKPLQKATGLKPNSVQEKRTSQTAVTSHKVIPEKSGGIKAPEPIKSLKKSSTQANGGPVAATRTQTSAVASRRPVSSTVRSQTPEKPKRVEPIKKTEESQAQLVDSPATRVQANKHLGTQMKLDPLRKVIKKSPLRSPLRPPAVHAEEKNLSLQEKSAALGGKPISKVSGIVSAITRKLPVKSSSTVTKGADSVKSQGKSLLSPVSKGKAADAVKLKSPLRGPGSSTVQEPAPKSAKIGSVLKKITETIKLKTSKKTVAASTQTEPVKSIGKSSTSSAAKPNKEQTVPRSDGVKKKVGNSILSRQKATESHGVKRVQPESRKTVGKVATSSTSAAIQKAKGGLCGIF